MRRSCQPWPASRGMLSRSCPVQAPAAMTTASAAILQGNHLLSLTNHDIYRKVESGWSCQMVHKGCSCSQCSHSTPRSCNTRQAFTHTAQVCRLAGIHKLCITDHTYLCPLWVMPAVFMPELSNNRSWTWCRSTAANLLPYILHTVNSASAACLPFYPRPCSVLKELNKHGA